MSKTSYYGFKVGQVVTLNESGTHDGHHLDRGTEFTITSFPPKVVKKDRTDVNNKGNVRDLFVCGTTVNEYNLFGGRKGKITVRVNLSKVCK